MDWLRTILIVSIFTALVMGVSRLGGARGPTPWWRSALWFPTCGVVAFASGLNLSDRPADFAVDGRCLGNRAAQNSCYTGLMEKTRQNVTLVVEEDLLLAARKVALDQRTSVNQLVREYLTALVEEPGRRRLARARLRRAFETGLVEVGERKWSRDDLYDR